MPAMRVSQEAYDTIRGWARPRENRGQVLDRILQVAIQGPPKEWLIQVIAACLSADREADPSRPENSPGMSVNPEDLARYILRHWAELRQLALYQRLGPGRDTEEGGA